MAWGNKIWCRLSLFWRFQLVGWAVFVVLTLPVKLILSDNLLGMVGSFVVRDGFSFLLTLAMHVIYERIYQDHKQPAWMIGSVAVVSLTAALLQLPVFYLLGDIFPFEEKTLFSQSVALGIFYYRTGLFTCWSLLYFGIKFFRDSMQRDLSLSQAEVARQRAELQMLRAQMNPHFLFNALATIRAGLARPGPQLEDVVQALADYLRYSLEHRNEDFVPLCKEFDAVVAYLAVEKARFREEMEIACRIDKAARAASCPGILLQPLVENAIKYGRQTSSLPVRLRLAITCPSPRTVRVEVANTGSWIEPTSRHDGIGGVGLENLRHRLALLYPANHALDIFADAGWVTIQINFPLASHEANRAARHYR